MYRKAHAAQGHAWHARVKPRPWYACAMSSSLPSRGAQRTRHACFSAVTGAPQGECLNSRRSAQQGIALLDALLAFLVLSIAAVATLRFNATLTAHAELAAQRTFAVRAAQSRLEALRHGSMLRGALGVATSAEPLIESLALHNATYRVNTALSPHRDWHLTHVKVTVDWQDPQGHAQSISLTSMIRHLDPELSGLAAMPRANRGASGP